MNREETETQRRIALALGAEPLEDARYLLPPLVLPPPAPPIAEGPYPLTEFIVDLTGIEGATAEQAQAIFAPQRRVGLGLAHGWAVRAGNDSRWRPLEEIEEGSRIAHLALTWELSGLFTEGNEAIEELARYTIQANALASRLGGRAEPRETPAHAAARAAALIALKTRFARTVEMRLAPQNRAFPARAVWRTVYALGLEWGTHDLFHWFGGTEFSLFTVSGLGHPTRFLPERAAEGEGAAGLSLSFELPLCPAPLDVYDRMAIALSSLRQRLGGRPLTPHGAELDSERLDNDRAALESAVHEMSRAGIAPGTPAARRFF